MSNPTILYVMGATNAGKSSLLAAMAEVHRERVALVEVGKAMRAKYLDPQSPHYQPDYFKGQAAPEHTQDEAWQMHMLGIAEGVLNGAELILVDGQPRDVPQAQMISEMIGQELRAKGPDDRVVPFVPDIRFLMVHCDHEVRLTRLEERFNIPCDYEGFPMNELIARTGSIENLNKAREGVDLGVQRMTTDYKALYHTTTALAKHGLTYEVLDTSDMVGLEGMERMRSVCPTIFDMYCG